MQYLEGGENVQYIKYILLTNFVTEFFLAIKYSASFGRKTTTNTCGPHIKCLLLSPVFNVNWRLSTEISKTPLCQGQWQSGMRSSETDVRHGSGKHAEEINP